MAIPRASMAAVDKTVVNIATARPNRIDLINILNRLPSINYTEKIIFLQFF